MGHNFKFNLTQHVEITTSGETGSVIGRAEYNNSQNQYLIRYKAADGRAVESWWAEEALSAEDDLITD